MVVVHGEPLGSYHPTPDREGNPQYSPHDCHLGGSTPHQMQVNLGDLADDELWQLMEDLCQEVTLRELNTPQRLTTDTLGNPVRNSDPDVDNQEVTFPRGGGWEPRGQHFHPLLTYNQVEGGNPEDSLLTPQHLLNPMRMWGGLSTHWPWDCNLVPLV